LPIGLFLFWSQASMHGWVSAQILPSPEIVLESARDFIPQDLLRELPISLYRLSVGLLGGIALGLFLGLVFGMSQLVFRLAMPLFTVLVQIPTLAWIPLLMLLLGISEALKLTILIKAVAVPVALYTCAGVQQISPKLAEMARTLRLTPWVFAHRLVWPSLLPFLMTGIRLAFSQGWVSLIAVELLASSEGLGYLLVQSRQLFMLDLVYVCVLVIGAFGFAGERLLLLLSQRWIYWPAAVTDTGNVTAMGAYDLRGWLLPLALVLAWQLVSGFGGLNSAFSPHRCRSDKHFMTVCWRVIWPTNWLPACCVCCKGLRLVRLPGYFWAALPAVMSGLTGYSRRSFPRCAAWPFLPGCR
jgi:sulfonate transport system permease protein